MNKAQLQDQIAPGSVGMALSTIWMTYGEAWRLVPADLNEVKYVALTAAIGVVCTALVNVVRRFTTGLPAEIFTPGAPQTEGERRMTDREESKP